MCACAFVFVCAQARVHQSLLDTDVNMSVGIDVQMLVLMYKLCHACTQTRTQTYLHAFSRLGATVTCRVWRTAGAA